MNETLLCEKLVGDGEMEVEKVVFIEDREERHCHSLRGQFSLKPEVLGPAHQYWQCRLVLMRADRFVLYVQGSLKPS